MGIGTTSPGEALEVNGYVKTSYVTIGGASNTTSPKNFANFASDNDGAVLLSSNLYLNADALYVANTHPTVAGTAIKIPGNTQTRQNNIEFWTTPTGSVTAGNAYAQSSPRVVIDPNGLVGIGNTSPVGKLDVSGFVAGKALAIFNETGDQNILVASASGVTQATLSRTGDLTLVGDIAVNGDTITSDGDLVVTPTGTLTLNSTGDMTLDSSTDIILDAAGSDILLKEGGTTFATFSDATTDLTLDIAGGQLFLAQDDDIVPTTTTGTSDLGSSAVPWDNIYVDNVYTTGNTSGFWQRNSGALAPTNITDDLLVGGVASSSAVFQVFGSGTSAGGATMSGTLTIGNGQTIRPAFGPLSLAYKSGLNAWTT